MVTDMQRLLIAILILLAPCLSLAGTGQVRAMMGMWGGSSSTSSCMAGTYTFAWTGDFTADTDKACSSSSDTVGIEGAITGTTISTTYGEAGSYGIIVDSGNDYVSYTTSADTHINPEAAYTVWARVYVSANPIANTDVFRACGSSDCSTGGTIFIQVRTSGEIYGQYNTYSNYSASTVATGQWADIAYTFDPVNQDHDVTHNGTNWSEDVNELVTAITTDTVAIFIGNKTTSSPSTSTVYIDKVAIVSGYRAAKPSGW